MAAAYCSTTRSLSFWVCVFAVFSQSAGNENLFDVPAYAVLLEQTTDGVASDLPFNVTLFNKRAHPGTKIWISRDGYISVGSEFRLQKVLFPLRNPAANPRLIMPYYAKMRYDPGSEEDVEAKVSYAWLDSIEDLSDVSMVIRRNAPSGSTFQARSGLLVTWAKIAPENPSSGSGRNTFQLMLATDGHDTYVIFNYDVIVWQPQNYAQAGFNTGGEGRLYTVPFSGPITDIDEGQASDLKGRYIFSVSGSAVNPVSCFLDDTSNSLQLSRSYGTIFGGDTIRVSGPCFSPGKKLECAFEDKIVEAVRESDSIISCTPPIQYKLGRVELAIMIDGVATRSRAFYTIVLPGRIKPGVLLDYEVWENAAPSRNLPLRWNSTALGQLVSKVRIKLFAYRETETEALLTEWLELAKETENDGEFEFTPDSVNCNEFCASSTELAAIAIESAAPDKARLWSDYLPTGWFVSPTSGRSKWATEQCRSFWKRDGTSRQWSEELLPCPCSLQQALSDFGRYQADVGCNIATGSTCTYHVGAVHCVRSVHATPGGAGNQCCYNKEGELMYAGDSDSGSTPDRSHTWGAPPYVKPSLVPEASHWLKDVVTFYYCCLWTSNSCYLYMDLRATKDCKEYTTPKQASVFGDPHFITFDGVSYTFNGKGDFLLMAADTGSDKFLLQGRFLQPGFNVNATVLRRIITKEGDSDIIEVVANDLDSYEVITIYVQNEAISFNAPELHWQEFKGPTYVSFEDGPSPSYTIIHRSGTGIKVSSAGGALNLVVMAPPIFKFKMSKGLLGTWDGDQTNEIAERADLTQRADIELYGNELKLDREDNSLFRYTQSFNLAYYNNVSGYAPHTAEPELQDTIRNSVLELCGDIKQCIFDMVVSGSKIIATSSVHAVELDSNYSRMLTEVVTCGMPVAHGVRVGSSYVQGRQVKVVGCIPGYSLVNKSDTETHQCSPTGEWIPSISAYCQFVGLPPLEITSEETGSDTLTIVLAVCVPAAVIAAGAVIFFVVIRNKKLALRKQKEEPKASEAKRGSPTEIRNYAFDATASTSEIHQANRNWPAEDAGRSYRVALGEQVPV